MYTCKGVKFLLVRAFIIVFSSLLFLGIYNKLVSFRQRHLLLSHFHNQPDFSKFKNGEKANEEINGFKTESKHVLKEQNDASKTDLNSFRYFQSKIYDTYQNDEGDDFSTLAPDDFNTFRKDGIDVGSNRNGISASAVKEMNEFNSYLQKHVNIGKSVVDSLDEFGNEGNEYLEAQQEISDYPANDMNVFNKVQNNVYGEQYDVTATVRENHTSRLDEYLNTKDDTTVNKAIDLMQYMGYPLQEDNKLYTANETVVKVPIVDKTQSVTEKPLLVLFSSFIDQAKEKFGMYKVLFPLWNFWPWSRAIAFTSSKSITELAVKKRWHVLPETKINPACKGAPLLPPMFIEARKSVDSYFHGYSNGDIIFDQKLEKTMLGIFHNFTKWKTQPVLIVGRRYNVDFKNVRLNISTPNIVNEVAKKYGKLVQMSTDFYFTNGLVPWEEAPKVSIGRPFIVRAIIGWALKRNFIVIDVTSTVTAVHLTTGDGNKAAFHKDGVLCNVKPLKDIVKNLRFLSGHCECANHETYRAEDGTFHVRKRTTFKGPFIKLCKTRQTFEFNEKDLLQQFNKLP